MHDRLRILRKEYLNNISQTVFGNRIGVSRDVIKNMELNLVEIKEHFIKLICKEWNVNEEWFRSGEGEVFEDIPSEDEYIRAAMEISRENDEVAMQMVIEYWKLDEYGKKLFKDFIVNIAKKIE